MNQVASEPSKASADIREMFGEVAPRYDRLNHLLSGSLDRLWRRRAARSLTVAGDRPVLDLCCGTGDQALALARHEHRVVAADFCIPMLTIADRKYDQAGATSSGASGSGASGPHGLAADALLLPFASDHFGGATVSFGLRNVADLDMALAEVRRVLVPGAELVVLEFAMPTLPLVKSAYAFYFRHLLPWIGKRISASDSAYTYLPDSVPSFPQRKDFLANLEQAGFDSSSWRDLSAGTVCLYHARVPGEG